ncbi:tyrosine-type recombinase/integrase, partial [Prevotella sp. S7-1-8]
TLEQGVPIETVSKMLGHSNVNMTERYAKVTPQKLFVEFERFLSFTEDMQMSI